MYQKQLACIVILLTFMQVFAADEATDNHGNNYNCCCKNGKDGKDGRDGRDGRDGVCPAVAPGKDGKDGRDGLDCKDCTRGSVFAKGLTCKDLKSSGHPSGIYYLNLPSGVHRVYCEMSINGGGYTFLPFATVEKMSQEDLAAVFTNSKDVLLRIARTDGTQPYTVISQYQNTGGVSVKLNSHSKGSVPVNKGLGPYLFLETHPNLNAGNGATVGFKANGQNVLYKTCGPGATGNYFSFHTNPKEAAPSSYHIENLAYESKGVAVDWRSKARNPHSMRRIPEDFFFFTEVHYYGCGCYTSSDRWLNAKVPALGTAIGLR